MKNGWLSSWREGRGASPVISVILIVAVTVIIASTVAVFALGVGNKVDDSAPEGSFSFSEADCGGIEVTYTAGDTFDGSRLYFTGAATEYNKPGSIKGWKGSEITASDSVVVGVKPGETLRVSWQDEESDDTAIVSKYDVPDDTDRKGSASISNLDAATGGDDWIAASVSFSNVNSVFVVTDTDGDGGEATATLNSPGDYSFSYDGAKKSGTTKIDVSSQTGPNVETPYSVTIYSSSNRNCQLASASS
jgi:hypothetical protein